MADNTVPDTQPDGHRDPFVVGDAGFKGAGVFATRDIEAGERFLVERCTLSRIDYTDICECTNNLIAAYLKLSTEDRHAILDLHYDKDPAMRQTYEQTFARYGPLSDAELEECLTVVLIHIANNFEILASRALPGGAKTLARSGVFVKASRFNHSCDPNCWYSTTSLEGHFICAPSRAIKAGEELTVSYIPNHATTETRQEEIRGTWKFECGCTKCQGVDSAFDAELEEAYALAFPNDPLPDHEPLPKSLGERHVDASRLVRRIVLLEKLGWLKELFFAYLDAGEFFSQLYLDTWQTDLDTGLEYVQRCEYFYDSAVSVGRQAWPHGDMTVETVKGYATSARESVEYTRRRIARQAGSST
ncbi:SET domain-containing protein [Daldinia caldariorum]|uniref:SET domain-containing protein n=1 Tax=Daldinia caldariorum TaxID=326644 RepID=UPI0020081165|nr:SET domain-containing protein [Daldinia caldariorum]KAI1471742.1 SET domain-containing protein [Daldinia caldariorum]